jgi:hypothetical protein
MSRGESSGWDHARKEETDARPSTQLPRELPSRVNAIPSGSLLDDRDAGCRWHGASGCIRCAAWIEGETADTRESSLAVPRHSDAELPHRRGNLLLACTRFGDRG